MGLTFLLEILDGKASLICEDSLTKPDKSSRLLDMVLDFAEGHMRMIAYVQTAAIAPI